MIYVHFYLSDQRDLRAKGSGGIGGHIVSEVGNWRWKLEDHMHEKIDKVDDQLKFEDHVCI